MPLRTPLFTAQLDHGAIMAEVGDWELPAEYGDSIAEHMAVRDGAGLQDRCARARLVVTGTDRLSWLQGMLTNDMRPLGGDAQAVCACVLNSTGHLLADVTVVRRDDGLILDLCWEKRRTIIELLEQYVITEDVEIVDQSEFLACLSAQGPKVGEAALREIAGGEVTISPADHTGEGGFDLYVRAEQAAALWTALVREGFTPVGTLAAETLRIEAGIPIYGIDMDESTIPLECRLEETHISHAKGCYVGQEIIARIHSRGHTNRALTGFFVEGAELPRHGEEIRPTAGDASREVGWVTSSCHSPSLKRSIALGYVRHEYREPGTHLRTAEAIPVIAAELPFAGRRD